jgi:hypothetical protein
MADGDHWTYAQWVRNTVNKIATLGAAAPEKDREDYLRVQVEAAIRKAFRNGQAGVSDDDPVAP